MDKNEKGYIELKSIIPNWQKARSKKQVIPMEGCGPYYHGYWLKNIENKDWFLKVFRESGIPLRFYAELFIEELANIIHIPTINSEIVEINKGINSYGLISEDYRRQDYSIISGKNILYEYLDYLEEKRKMKDTIGISSYEEIDNLKVNINSLDFIWEALNFHFKDYAKKSELVSSIMNQLVKRYSFSFLVMQSDFHAGNWEVLENDNIAYLAPMYDLDMSFRSDFFNFDKNTSMRSYMNPVNNIYDDFRDFFNSSTDELKLQIENDFKILSPDVLNNVMDTLAKEKSLTIPIEVRNKILKRYGDHYEKIMEITNNRSR